MSYFPGFANTIGVSSSECVAATSSEIKRIGKEFSKRADNLNVKLVDRRDSGKSSSSQSEAVVKL